MEKKRTFKEIIIWCFTKPIIKIYFFPDEEKQFKEGVVPNLDVLDLFPEASLYVESKK